MSATINPYAMASVTVVQVEPSGWRELTSTYPYPWPQPAAFSLVGTGIGCGPQCLDSYMSQSYGAPISMCDCGLRVSPTLTTYPSLRIYGVAGGATYYLDDLSNLATDLADPARLAGLGDNVRMTAALPPPDTERLRAARGATDT